MIKKEIVQIRELMKAHEMDCYIVFTNDYHSSEYLGEYFKERQFLSGFSGSNGNLMVTLKDAKLWTDGRYFIQATHEMKNSGIELMKMAEPGVPTLLEYIQKNHFTKIGLDLKLTTFNYYNSIKNSLKENQEIIDINLVDKMWDNRPALSKEKAFLLTENYSGESYLSKLDKIVHYMKEEKASNYLFTRLDDINYLLNLRGHDILFTPYFLSYFLIKESVTYLYANDIFTTDILGYLKDNHIVLKDYFDIYKDISLITDSILVDQSSVNASLMNAISPSVKIINRCNIIQKMKSIKNDIEIKNTKLCHIKDGVAVTKIMKYLKENSGSNSLDEFMVQEKLEHFRKEQINFIENSFYPICAYNENAAMMHYSASKNQSKVIKGNGLLLIDSGGQYLEGTTDITRTFGIGTVPQELKKHFTLVLKSMINLSKVKFLYGCRGTNLDILARGPIWNYLLDYKCGTGHGVSHVGGVHEGPNGFRWKIAEERNDSCILEPGMITTNEPGIYIENSHGIRIENEMLCKYISENEYGKFLEFETITFAPIDLDCIDKKYLNEEEISFLNKYHQEVYRTLSGYFETKEELNFLKKYTKLI